MSYVIFMKKKEIPHRMIVGFTSPFVVAGCIFAVKHFIFNAVCGRVEIERGNLYSSSYVRSMTDTVDIKFNDTSINYYLFSVY